VCVEYIKLTVDIKGLILLENSEHDTTQLSALKKNNLRFEFNSSLYKNLVLWPLVKIQEKHFFKDFKENVRITGHKLYTTS